MPDEGPTIDLSDESISQLQTAYPEREQVLDKWRGGIAIALLAILAGIVFLAFAAVMADLMTLADVKELLIVVFSPVVALVGTALGFFYGGRTGGDGRGQPPKSP